MDTNQLIERVIDISHSEDAPDTALRQKALGWINSAYHELIDEILPYLYSTVGASSVIDTDANGMGVHPAQVRQIISVYDDTGTRYSRISAEKMAQSPASNTFYTVGGAVYIYPKTAKTLTAYYMPISTDLAIDGAEVDNILDTAHHHALVWGALVWGSAYERAFSSQGDLILFQRKWNEAKQRIKLFYSQQAEHRKNVRPYEFI